MPRGTALTEEEMGFVRALNEEKKSTRYISFKVKRSQSLISRYLRSPETYNAKKRSGRKRKLSDADRRRLIREVRTTQCSLNAAKRALELSVYKSNTARELLRSVNFELRKARGRFFLTARRMRQRVDWARERVTCTLSQWKRCAFSDEKKFNCDHPDGWSSYRHHTGAQERVFLKRQNGGPSLMTWACFSFCGKPQIVFTGGRQTAATYVETLKDNILLWAAKNHGETWTFQQDNCSIHIAKKTKAFFREKTSL